MTATRLMVPPRPPQYLQTMHTRRIARQNCRAAVCAERSVSAARGSGQLEIALVRSPVWTQVARLTALTFGAGEAP